MSLRLPVAVVLLAIDAMPRVALRPALLAGGAVQVPSDDSLSLPSSKRQLSLSEPNNRGLRCWIQLSLIKFG